MNMYNIILILQTLFSLKNVLSFRLNASSFKTAVFHWTAFSFCFFSYPNQ